MTTTTAPRQRRRKRRFGEQAVDPAAATTVRKVHALLSATPSAPDVEQDPLKRLRLVSAGYLRFKDKLKLLPKVAFAEYLETNPIDLPALAARRRKAIYALALEIARENAAFARNVKFLNNVARDTNPPDELLPELNALFTGRHDYVEVAFHDEWNGMESVLRVRTHPVTLIDTKGEVHPLGSFDICLACGRGLRDARLSAWPVTDDYVSKLDPDVGHPHVRLGDICMGEAEIMVYESLQAGRLSMAFDAIVAVLNNYNPDSPFIRLESWDTEMEYCDACECDVEELFHCECGNPYCESCSSSCDVCSSASCSECVSRTEPNSAGRRYYACKECAANCDECGNYLLEDDLNGDRLCPACRKCICAGCEGAFDEDELENDLCPSCVKLEEEAEEEAEADDDESEAEDSEDDAEVVSPASSRPSAICVNCREPLLVGEGLAVAGRLICPGCAPGVTVLTNVVRA